MASEGASLSPLGSIGGRKEVFAVLDNSFLMGSMGTAVGEKITRAAELAEKKKLPLIIFAASGGAHMQEGILSLVQRAKTAAAIRRFQSAGGLYISCLTDPTTGGVTASFASLRDVMLSEPEALIGFAGPRVIEQTIAEKLPAGFQRAEYLLEHGFLDQWREFCSSYCHSRRKEGADPMNTFTPEQKVKLARYPSRPGTADYIQHLFIDFFEQQDDCQCRDDSSILGGVARFYGQPVTVIGHRKGRTLEEKRWCVGAGRCQPGPHAEERALL